MEEIESCSGAEIGGISVAKQKSVFISYSSKDKTFVQKIVKMLKEMGVNCWKAPEMIPAGSSYAKEIPKAIRECEVFLLMLSRTAQESIWVEKETDSAISNRKNIIPFQIDDAPLNETFRFYLNNVQMISYMENSETAIEELKEMLSQLAVKPETLAEGKPQAEAGVKKEQKTSQKMSFARNPGNSNALRLNRIPLECKACGSKKLSNVSRGIFRCDECGEENYDDYQTVRNYLEQVGMAPAVVIEQNTGVPMRVITHFFREEYLEIPKNSAIRVPCERCGMPIRTGTLCDSCKKIKGAYSVKDSNVGWHS